MEKRQLSWQKGVFRKMYININNELIPHLSANVISPSHTAYLCDVVSFNRWQEANQNLLRLSMSAQNPKKSLNVLLL